MTLDQKKRLAADLHACGVRFEDIAGEFGVCRSTAHAWITDPDGERARARKERYRRLCLEGCGRLLSGSDGNGPNAPKRCVYCDIALKHERRRQRGQNNRERLVALWNAGLTVDHIARELGWTKGSVRSTVVRCRHMGMDVAYRNHYTPEGLAKQAEVMRRNRRVAA